jgi:choloylglycine hydrolase
MWHQEAQYPEKDSRPGLTELQWIQYQLDMSATVNELVTSDSVVCISNASVATLHFLVADSTGAAAVIDFLDGKMRVYKDAELPYTALANCSYEVSLDYKNRKLNDSGAVFSGWTENSSGRFSKAAKMLSDHSPANNAIDYCYAILDSVAQGNQTQWRIVYDQQAKSIFYRSLEQPLLQKVSLSDFDFGCEQPNLYIDMQVINRDESALSKFSVDANYALINGVCEAVEFLSQLPVEYRKAVAAYPANFECDNEK